ncbi:hypothetical protein [Cohnella sp.]|uniref:hypothetical protein n=1 Tax=Cohnella sp. TaxID=1883426 RepID=UPI00356ADB86
MTSSKGKINFKAGIIASLVGGLIMAIPMGMMGSLPGIATMVGSDTAVVGFIVHMVISLIFGIAFSVFASMIKLNPAVIGLIFGVIIWVIGPLLLMPMLTGGAGACGTAACGTAEKSACGTVEKSACGTVKKSACGTVDKSACGTAAVTSNACGNPCAGGGASAMLLSLATHLLYGLITGVTFKMVARKTA